LDNIKNSSINVFNNLKNLIKKKVNEDEILNKSSIENKIQLEKEILTISARKKYEENDQFHKEIKFNRNYDFKNLTPLEINKKEKFVFENNVCLIKENKFNRNNQQESNNEKHFSNLKKTTQIIDCLSSFDSINSNKLKNLDFLNFEEKIKNFYNDSNIQGVNKLISSYDFKDYLKEENKFNNKNHADELLKNKNKENEKTNKDSKIFKSKISKDLILNKKSHLRSNSLTNFDLIEDPKTYIINFLENRKDTKKDKNDDFKDKSNKSHIVNDRLNSSFDAIPPKIKINILENDFKSKFNKTEIIINFKNKLFEKVEKKFFSNDKNNKQLNQIQSKNENNDNNITPSKFNNMNFESLQMSNKKIIEKIKDMNYRFKLTDNIEINNIILNKKKNDFFTIKPIKGENEIAKNRNNLKDKTIYFSNGNKIDNEFTKKLNNFNNISNQAKLKLNEINLITERLKNLQDKNEKKSDNLTKKTKTTYRYNIFDSEDKEFKSNYIK